MDLSAALATIKTLSIEDRIRLAQEIWDSIPEADQVPEVSDEVAAVLDRRLAELRANPEIALTWDEIKARLAKNRP